MLNDFRFECIGEVETDDEIHIGKLNDVHTPGTIAALRQFRFYSLGSSKVCLLAVQGQIKLFF